MLKDRKSTKIILLIIVIVLMLMPGFRIFHLRGGLMRDKNLDAIDLYYDNIGMLHAESTSGDIELVYDDSMSGIHIEAEHGSANIGGSNNNLTIKTVSDDMKITFGQGSIEELRAYSTSGDIEANYPTLDTLDLSTTSGSINVEGGNIASALSLSSTSGSIDINNVITDNLYASVKSGDLDITGTRAESMTLTSISGSIELLGSSAEDMRITTTSGSTRLEAADEYSIDYNMVSGKISTPRGTMKGRGLYGNEDSPLHIQFKSTSGNLEIM